MSDKLILEGVFSKGYGTVPKLVMKDTDLTIEAKGIYAYLCSYAGAGETAFPSVDLICSDLGIGEKRFYKHRKLLEEKGYLKIERVRQDRGFSKNIYTISSVVSSQNDSIRNDSVSGQNDHLRNDHLQNDHLQNDGTNNNNINNNSINNNNINNNNHDEEKSENSKFQKSKPENKKDEVQETKAQTTKEVHRFYQENFGIESQYIAQELEYLVEDLNVELVLEAMKRAIEYGKEFGYAKRIMKNWENKGIDTMDKVQQADVEFERKTQQKFNNKSKVRKVESLPDWFDQTNEEQENTADASTEQTDTNSPDLIEDSSVSERLQRLNQMRKEMGRTEGANS